MWTWAEARRAYTFAMSIAVAADPVPIAPDSTGTLRVGGTRVTLDTVVASFNEGFSAEEIQVQFPALDLADVYGAIAYYLRHKAALDHHLEAREREGEILRQEIETRFPNAGIRDRLLARRAAQTLES